MTAHTRLDPPLVESIRKALTGNALPGETQGLRREAEREAADSSPKSLPSASRASSRSRSKSTGGEAGNRRMRIGIVNDDMPFLVDSVANAIAARQLTIHRLLHPVVCVDRDDKGVLQRVEPLCGDKSRRESMMYLELDRADARGRQELAADLRRVLDDVRAGGARLAQAAGQDARGRRGDRRPEGAALLELVRRRGDDLARLSCRKAVRAAVRRARHLQHPRRADRRGRLPRRDALFREGRRSAADGQGRAQVDGPPPRAARPGRGADPRGRQGHRDRRPCRPVDQRSAARPPENVPVLRERLERARPATSASTPRAIRARRCATRSRRCRATC